MSAFQNCRMCPNPNMVFDHNIRSAINSLTTCHINDRMRISCPYLKIPRQHTIVTDRYSGSLTANKITPANCRTRTNSNGIIIHQLHYYGGGYSATRPNLHNITITQQLHPNINEGYTLADDNLVIIAGDYNFAI
ncbi:protein of unknown function (plasmid) [Cupriavidus neocaledonicus]|uniref:Uncharacterized protein n=1 Tax=Cupriavidus neocaledonicus TaxID=1040979 RepID=A0A375HRK4_9BURK|nr:hypothetical protein CBM2605_B100250 [Cupriavidus neocaledonicus]SPD60063.1 protein of unknown function [Cupriavidus neocaledonicus]